MEEARASPGARSSGGLFLRRERVFPSKVRGIDLDESFRPLFLSLSLSFSLPSFSPSQMLCAFEKIPPVPGPTPLPPPLQLGGGTTRSMDDDDDDGIGVVADRCCCCCAAAAADSARTRSCRMASASSSSLPMAGAAGRGDSCSRPKEGKEDEEGKK